MDIGTDLFVMAATCSYANLLAKKQNNDSAIDLANYFCELAERRINRNFDELTDNDDLHTNSLAKRVVTNGDFKWLEEGIIRIGPED